MPFNKRLDGVLVTEKASTETARWLLDLLTKLEQAAPAGSIEHDWRVRFGGPLVTAVDFYRAHRGQHDSHRSNSHHQLCLQLRQSLSNVKVALRLQSAAVPSPEEFEQSVKELLDKQVWRFSCQMCGRNTVADNVLEGQVLCGKCYPIYTSDCAQCGKRGWTQSMATVINDIGINSTYCQDHQPVGLESCERCGCSFSGPKNNGHPSRQQLTEAGVCACHHCSSEYRQQTCGHWSYGRGHAQSVVEHREDDNRLREDVMHADHVKRVCDKCFEKKQAGDDLEFWRLDEPQLAGRTFQDLRSRRTYGVELEFCAVKSLPALNSEIKQWWTAKQDDSLPRGGVELASTILQGDEGLAVIKSLCEYAKAHDWAVDARSGFHLHIGLPEGNKEVAAVAMGYMLTHRLWSQLVAPSRSSNCKYCRPLKVTPAFALTLPVDKYIYHLTQDGDRRIWCNWQAYRKFATVELRIHQGTRVYEKVANWIKAHTRFCDWCVGLADPKLVYEALQPLAPRDQFLLLSQAAWKDRELGRWFRDRALALHGERNLLTSHRQLRKAGVDPRAVPVVPPVQRLHGVPAYVINSTLMHWYLCDRRQQTALKERACYIQRDSGKWGQGNAMQFTSKDQAEAYLAVYADQAEPVVAKPNRINLDSLAHLLTAEAEPPVRPQPPQKPLILQPAAQEVVVF